MPRSTSYTHTRTHTYLAYAQTASKVENIMPPAPNHPPSLYMVKRRGCDLNPGPSAPESSTLTTRLLSHHAEHVTPLLFTYCLHVAMRSPNQA